MGNGLRVTLLRNSGWCTVLFIINVIGQRGAWFNVDLSLFLIPYRRCSGCRKRRSLRANSFFEEYPKVALGKLLLLIYYFAAEDSQRRTALYLSLNPSLVSSIYRRLQDVCSRDLQERPIIPFGGPGTVAKCDESKFNHNPKVTFNSTFVYYLRPLSQTFNCTCFVLRTKNTRSNLSHRVLRANTVGYRKIPIISSSLIQFSKGIWMGLSTGGLYLEGVG